MGQVKFTMANASLKLLDDVCAGKLPAPPDFSRADHCNAEPLEAMYDTETRLLMTIIFSTLSLIGVIGNLLVITVVLRVKGMKTPTNCYLVSLALSDTLFFIATAPTELSYLHVPAGEYIFGDVAFPAVKNNPNDLLKCPVRGSMYTQMSLLPGCALFSYLPYLAINSSSLSITAFTIERFIGICYPYRARTICTVKRARLIIFCIWLFSIIYNSPWLYLASLGNVDGVMDCSFKLDRSNWTYKVMFLGDFFAFYTIPMLLNIIIYGRIAVTLARSGEFEGEKSKSEKSKNGDMPFEGEKETYVSGRRKSAGKNQVVKMLALVVIVFATCWLPYRAMVMYNSFASLKWSPDWYIFFSKTLIFINCAINPILYNLMSGRFRGAFRSLLKGDTKPSQYLPVLDPRNASRNFSSRMQHSQREKTTSQTPESTPLSS